MWISRDTFEELMDRNDFEVSNALTPTMMRGTMLRRLIFPSVLPSKNELVDYMTLIRTWKWDLQNLLLKEQLRSVPAQGSPTAMVLKLITDRETTTTLMPKVMSKHRELSDFPWLGDCRF